MKNMGKERGRRILIEWVLFGGAMLVLTGMLVAGLFVIDLIANNDRGLMANLIVGLTALYLIGFVAAMIVFLFRIREAHNPRPYREAAKIGLPASAVVVEAVDTGITSGRSGQSLRPTTYQIQMRLRITHPDLPEYEAETTHYFRGGEIPKEGAVLAVKVHPHQPDVVVIA